MTHAKVGTASHGRSLVLGSVVVGVKELLEPLNKLKVVLKSSLNQFVNGNDLKSKLQAKVQLR